MILLVDNYDSFVHNLARYFRRLGQETIVVRNGVVDLDHVQACPPSAIVISPGPCSPTEAGCSLDIVRRFAATVPILGVCLGHQTIAAAFGSTIGRAPVPMHGRTSMVEHDGRVEYAGLPSPMQVGRYHSLVAIPGTLSPDLEISAWTPDGVIMGIRHRRFPCYGIQFHPESILTEYGFAILANFLRHTGHHVPDPIPSLLDERSSNELDVTVTPNRPLPNVPVTF